MEQNWNGSRWEFTKSRSKYHFDPQRKDLPEDVFKYCGSFQMNFEELIQKFDPAFVERSWRTRNNRADLYSAPLEEADLIAAGADPSQPVFMRAEAQDEPVFNTIASDILGLTGYKIKVHKQTTGQMLHLHIDNFAGSDLRENSFKETEFDRDPSLMRRFAIQLADWQMGQIWTFGNLYWSQWRAGEAVTWDWQDMPHATANCGWYPRYMLQITGWVSDKTRAFLAETSKDRVYDLR